MVIVPSGTGSPEDEFVEYDMDTEDEEWVKNFNKGQPRLAESKFERMVWKLELACSDATEKTLRAAGECYHGCLVDGRWVKGRE